MTTLDALPLTTLDALLGHAAVASLGWTLLHFVWQGALVALLLAGADALLADASARARYAAACAALALMLLLPAATFLVLDASPRASATAPDVRVASDGKTNGTLVAVAGASGLSRPAHARAEEERAESAESGAQQLAGWASARFASALPWLVLAWALCVCGLLARLAGGWAVALRLRGARASAPVSEEWQRRVALLARRMKVARAVRVCRSALVEVPTVVGWLRPVILVPVGALAGMSAAQLEAVLAHELAHVRRHDYLVNLIQAFVETLLFYHPAVWWVSARVREEREHVCDDLAVEATGDVLLYMRALAALEDSRRRGGEAGPQLALAANGGSLMHRIQRLIRARRRAARRATPAAALAVAFATVCALACAHAALATQGRGEEKSRASAAPARKAERGGTRRRVAVTFVAMPMLNTYYAPRAERDMRRLLDSLSARNVRAVGFVNARQLYGENEKVNEEKVRLLRMWLDAGHELGSEGYAHLDLFNVPLEDFKRDILRGEELTGKLAAERGQGLRYFSYPFLNVGPDRETKEAFEQFLAARGQRAHKVTIDNWDWVYGRVFMDARRAEDEAKMKRVGDEYVEYMERAFAFYEQLSRDTLGYEPPQVLMLTASGMNCLKSDELLSMLERRGYEFVTLEEAMSDPAYQLPDTYTGPLGISWLQRWAMAKGRDFREEPYLSPWMAQFHTRKAPPVKQPDKDKQ